MYLNFFFLRFKNRNVPVTRDLEGTAFIFKYKITFLFENWTGMIIQWGSIWANGLELQLFLNTENIFNR